MLGTNHVGFQKGDEISFATNGASNVHLTGYINDDIYDDDEVFEEEQEVEEEEEEEVENKRKRNKKNAVSESRKCF